MRPARALVKATAAAADLVRRPPPGLVVLIYHHVGARTRSEIDLPISLFEQQVRFLAEECRVVTLDEGLTRVATPCSDPGTIVAVTFDDGAASFTDVALPVLQQHAIPVTLYAATSFIDSGSPLPGGATPTSWVALRDAVATGLVEVGSHTHRHALLDRVPAPEVADDLDRSIDTIATHLGAAPRHFAYPKAVRPSVTAEEEVRSRFASAALAGTRVNRFGATDAHRLARSPVLVGDGTTWFARKARGGLALEDRLRRTYDSYRYRHVDA